MSKKMTYTGSGVDYDKMDPFKRMAQLAGQETDQCIERFGFSVVPWTRGESVFLIETPWGYLAIVVEGLGTKNLVADAMYQIAKEMGLIIRRSFYDKVAQCNVAMAVNDMITLGALPICYGQYLAVGSSEWFNDQLRSKELVEGTKKACLLARCVWGGGETPTLKDIIIPGASDLSGATIGIINPKERIINPAKIKHGDAIIFIESSGIHANGLTLNREIAEKLPNGYLTKLRDGRTYGETLLEPTHIYVGLIEDCLDAGVDIHYAVNITGHGWRKLMRAEQNFSYIIHRLPRQQPIFDFIKYHGPVDDKEAYGNLNMGAGYALYTSKNDVEKVEKVADRLGYTAFEAGVIETSNNKNVIIEPKKLEYQGSSLGVR